MDIIEFFGNIFLLTFSIFAGLFLAFSVVWPLIKNYLLKSNALQQSRLFTKENMQLRFHAYERLLLFSHRIEPQQMMLRHYGANKDMKGRQLLNELIAEVEAEFQHNLTQQLYVSDVAWEAVRTLKENTVALFRNAGRGIEQDIGADRYIGIVLTHLEELETNPYTEVQQILKNEIN